jgi:hypothetical protein
VASCLLSHSSAATAPHQRVRERVGQGRLGPLRERLVEHDILIGGLGVPDGDAAKVAVAKVGVDQARGLVGGDVVAGVLVDGGHAAGQAEVQLGPGAGAAGQGGGPRVVGEAARGEVPRARDVVRVGVGPSPGRAARGVVEPDQEGVQGHRRDQLAHAGVGHGTLGRAAEGEAGLGGCREETAQLRGKGYVSGATICSRSLVTSRSAFLCSPRTRGVHFGISFLLTVGRGLNVEQEAVDRRAGRVAGHVQGPGQSSLDPYLVPGPKEAEKHVCKDGAVRDSADLVFTRATAKGQQDLLPIGPLACRDVGRELGAAGLQLVFGRVHHTVVARPGIDGAAALVSKACAGVPVGLGWEEVDVGEGDGIDLGLLAIVRKRFLVFSLALDRRASSDIHGQPQHSSGPIGPR